MPDQGIQNILTDLPQIQRIASAPLAQNPLLLPLLQSAEALTKIAQWAADAQALAQREAASADEPPSVAEALGLPEDADIKLVPTTNGTAKRRAGG